MKSKYIAFATLLTVFVSLLAPRAFADEGASCTNQYGATVACPTNQIVINKKVRYPTNMYLFVENLTANDTAYSPGEVVEYDVAVTNTSAVNFATVTVIDVFPSQTTFVAGPGTYNAAENKLTYELSDLLAGTTVHNRILVKVKDVSVFASDITCEVVNTITATGPGGQSDKDTANLCVQTKVLGATTLPVAGFADSVIALPFAVLGVVGLTLFVINRRKALP